MPEPRDPEEVKAIHQAEQRMMDARNLGMMYGRLVAEAARVLEAEGWTIEEAQQGALELGCAHMQRPVPGDESD